jgi:hypothetical protein
MMKMKELSWRGGMGGISSVEVSWDHSFGESKEVRLLSFFHDATAAVSAARTSTTVGLFWFFIGLHVLVVVT